MRIHLPYTLARDPEPMYMYSQMAGIDACKTLLTRYNILRGNLPAAFFLGRLLDIQAFAASVVLLLTSQRRKQSADAADARSLDETIDGLIPRTVALMEEKCRDVVGATNYGKVGASTIRTLSTLLSTSPDDESEQQELTLKVPLLGKINVRRRQPNFTEQQIEQPGLCLEPETGEVPLMPGMSQQQPDPGVPVDASLINALSVRDWQPQYEPFSWSVVSNYDDAFQDALMSDVGFGDWYDTRI